MNNLLDLVGSIAADKKSVLYLGLLLLNPVWISAIVWLVAIAVFLALRRVFRSTKLRMVLFAVAVAAYSGDMLTAVPRVLFSYSLSAKPLIERQFALPAQLILAGVSCDAECHRLIMGGYLDEVIVISRALGGGEQPKLATRYRAAWVHPGKCPGDRLLIASERAEILATGYCPSADTVEVPTEGVFVVREGIWRRPSEEAIAFTPSLLTVGPPGRVIQFTGVEVQRRQKSTVTISASAYYHEAPGFLAPLLVGCWHRPDNVFFILPPGDTGCGFWRWFTWGGTEGDTNQTDWVFKNAFDKPKQAPFRIDPKFEAIEPKEAISILWSNEPVRTFLPKVRDALIANANSDEDLKALVLRLARRGNLEGSLIVELAQSRPTSLNGLAEQLFQAGPKVFLDADLAVAQMERDPALRESFSEAAFIALPATWQRRDVDRYLDLIEATNPNWFCHRLDRVEPLLLARAKAVPSLEGLPYFAQRILARSERQCPSRAVEIIGKLMKDGDERRRAGLSFLVATEMPRVAPVLAEQAFVYLVQADSLTSRDPYRNNFARLLNVASLTCADLADRLSARIAEAKDAEPLAEKVSPHIDRVRGNQYPELCKP